MLKDLFDKNIKVGAACATSARYLNDMKLVRGTVVSTDKYHATISYVYKHARRHVLDGTVSYEEKSYTVKRLPEDIVIV